MSGGDDAGGLALIVGGADGGVPLDVFQGAHTGAERMHDVLDGGVALDVDELHRAVRVVGVGDSPQHGRWGGVRRFVDAGKDVGGDRR